MQIGSGQSPLTLAVMKALGVQVPAAPVAASPAPAAGNSSKVATGLRAAADLPTATDLGVAKTIPRGSFVDFKA